MKRLLSSLSLRFYLSLARTNVYCSWCLPWPPYALCLAHLLCALRTLTLTLTHGTPLQDLLSLSCVACRLPITAYSVVFGHRVLCAFVSSAPRPLEMSSNFYSRLACSHSCDVCCGCSLAACPMPTTAAARVVLGVVLGVCLSAQCLEWSILQSRRQERVLDVPVVHLKTVSISSSSSGPHSNNPAKTDDPSARSVSPGRSFVCAHKSSTSSNSSSSTTNSRF